MRIIFRLPRVDSGACAGLEADEGVGVMVGLKALRFCVGLFSADFWRKATSMASIVSTTEIAIGSEPIQSSKS
jgi:hypothetical protein